MLLRPRCNTIWKHVTCVAVFFVFIWLQTRAPDTRVSHTSNITSRASNLTATTIGAAAAPLRRFFHHVPANTTPLQYTMNANSDAHARIVNLRRTIAKANDEQTMYNQEVFGAIASDTVIIVVQVNVRTQYLRQLITSLALVRGIESALLVFSHDVYSDDINEVVQTIEFARVIQIYYPYSIQTRPNEFPGPDPKDCPRNIGKKEAALLQCKNAMYPDLYGHYREAKFTQTKHHWWWKANHVFLALNATRNHTGFVIFLEEDHYVLPDFIYMIDKMTETAKKRCPNCNVFTLGNYIRTYAYMHEINKVEVTPWVSNRHNMAMGLTRATWLDIVKCRTHFCHYDDYNWDWSLLYTSQVCLKDKLKALVVKSTRTFHIGECGVHHTKENCDPATIIDKIKRLSHTIRKIMFPEHLVYVHSTNAKKVKLRKGNGGWGDVRDHKLCVHVADCFLAN